MHKPKLITSLLSAAAIAALAVMTISISACSTTSETTSAIDPTDTTTQATQATQATPTPSPTPSPSPTPTPLPKIDHTGHEGIKEYSALKDLKYGVTGVVNLPNGNIVVSTISDYINGYYKEVKNRHTDLVLIDTAEDKIIKTVTTVDSEDALMDVTADGRIVVHNEISRHTDIYSSDLELLTTLEDTGLNACYDCDKDRIVYVDHGQTCARDTAGNEEVFVDKTYTSGIRNYDPINRQLLLSDTSTLDTNVLAFKNYDLNTQLFSDLYMTDGFDELFFCGDDLLTVRENTKKADVSLRDRQTGTVKANYKIPFNMNVNATPFSDKCLIIYMSKYKNAYRIKKAIIAQPSTGKYADPGIVLNDMRDPVTYYDKDTGHFYIADTVKQSGTKARLIEICPEAFDYTESLETGDISDYAIPADKYQAGDHLAEARARADQLEKKYGIEILIGDEIKNEQLSDSYELISVEDSKSKDKEDHLFYTNYALNIIDDSLSKYGSEFFTWFKDYTGGGGLTFALVDELVNHNGNFMASAENIMKGSHNLIICDVNTICNSTVHHELWHATENIIMIRDPNAFPDDEWNALNPEGFKYPENLEKYTSSGYDDYCNDSYMNTDKNNIYFARIYSVVNPHEDRATLIESFFGDDYSYDMANYNTALEYVSSFPHLKAKVDYVRSTCERVFGKCYW